MHEASAPLVELVDVTRRFPGVVALDQVCFALRAGEVHALVGENGAGKSTLINIISGVLAPDEGRVLVAGQPVAWSTPTQARRQGIVTVHQEAELFGTLSVAENMALEQGLPTRFGCVSWRQIRHQARHAVQLLGEPIDVLSPAAHLSVGQRHMTQIAAAVFEGARVLVLDEPTSALTAREVGWLFEQIARLKAAGVGIVYISHRQEEVFALADKVTVLRDGRRVWCGPRAEIDRPGLVRHMVGRERAGEISQPRTPRLSAAEAKLRLVVQGLTAADGRFGDVSFSARGGQVLGIYGLIGSGRSELAQALFGLNRVSAASVSAGNVSIDGRHLRIRRPADALAAGLAYLPEDRLRQGVFRGLSVRANTVISTLGAWAAGPLASAARERTATARQIAALDIKCQGTEQPIGQLSGGNQQKVVLARWLLAAPAVLILDEPTRGVDVRAKAEIHHLVRQLADAGTAVIMISSDLPEIMEHSDRILVFRSGQVAAELDPSSTTPEIVAASALPQGTGGGQADRLRARRWSFPGEAALAAAIVLLFVLLGLSTESFLTPANLLGLASSIATLTLLSLAAAVVILAGGIDISLGANLALSAGVAGLVLKLPHAPAVTIPLAIAAATAVAAAAGLVNATLSLAGRIHPIVVTLGTMTIFRGLLIALTGGETLTDLPADFVRWSSAPVGFVNGSVILAAVVAAAVYVWLNYARSGRHLIAYGASPTAARLIGVTPWRVWPLAFGVGGLLAGVAGVLELSQTGAMQSSMGTGDELQAIAGAVIGGVSITGGRGSVIGVCLGACLLGLIRNAFVFWQISPYHYSLVTGSLLLAPVLLDLVVRRRER